LLKPVAFPVVGFRIRDRNWYVPDPTGGVYTADFALLFV